MRVSRVLLVSPSFHPAHRYGGPTHAGWLLARSLAESGLEVRVLTTNADGPDVIEVPVEVEREVLPGLRVSYLARRGTESFAPSLFGRLPEAVRWAEVVHLAAVYNATTFPTLRATRSAGRPLVWTPWGAHLRWAGSNRPVLKAMWDRAARALVEPSRTTMHAASELEAAAIERRVPGVRVEVVPHGVSLPAPPVRAPRAEGPVRALFLGRLDPIKGLERLLDALEEPGSQATLTLAGEGEPDYVRTLSERAARLGGRARFVGQVGEADKPALFAAHDVLVLPSYQESFGIVVIEALAHALPVMATTETPWSRLDEEGAGWWVRGRELGRALGRVLEHDLDAMGTRGRAWVERELEAGHIAHRMRHLYDDLAARGNGGSGS